MAKKFSIRLVTAEDIRPAIPFKVVEYFEGFVYEHVLKPLDIIINAKPNVLLAFTIMRTGNRIPDRVAVLKPQVVNTDKLYTVIMPLDQILQNNNIAFIVELFKEALHLFLVQNYKKAKPAFLDELLMKIDLPYLLSLPYPAPQNEVRYLGDNHQ